MVTRIRSWMALCVVCVAWSAAPASADVRVAVTQDGVDLVAQQSTVREILEAWAKAAGTTFIGLESLPSERLTLSLHGLPERAVLEILLRSVSGYIIMPKAAGAPGASQFSSVRILATSTARADSAAARPLAIAPVATPFERAETENVEVPIQERPDETGADSVADGAPAGTRRRSPAGAGSDGFGRHSPQEAARGAFGLPAGVKPGEPIGDPFSRPGMIPAWLQGSGMTSGAPGAMAIPQMKTPDASGSLMRPSPLPQAPVAEPSPSN